MREAVILIKILIVEDDDSIAKADAWLDDNITEGNLKVAVLFDKWIEELKLTTSKDHWRQYYGYGEKWIKPKIGNIRISNITEQHLQEVILNGHKKGLAKKTLMNMRACISAFIKYCRKRKSTKLIVENVTIPKNAPVGIRTILQPDELKTLMNDDTTIFKGKLVRELYINAYRFEVVTGLRPGEVIGLRKTDRNDKIISINRSLNQFGEITPGKNQNAKRPFMLTAIAENILDQQEKLLRENNIDSDYIFPNEYGDFIPYQTYYKHWKRYRDYHNLSKASPYELRHTFVSVVKTLPEGLLKQVVGHSESMDTYGVYSHNIDGDMEKAAIEIQTIFSEIIK